MIKTVIIHWKAAMLICILALTACQSQKTGVSALPLNTESQPLSGEARNVILLIGDGMGLSQITAGMYMNNNQTSLEHFPYVGLHKSHSADNLVTDSAAGATAFACGAKTVNRAVAVDPNGKSLQTILEEAMAKGKSTGMIVTSTIVHATPASFAAHNIDRNAYQEIALDMHDAGVDLLIGGGMDFFTNRADGRNLVSEMKNNGYQIGDFNGPDIAILDFPTKKKFAYFTAASDPVRLSEGRKYFVPAVMKGIDYLARVGKENGYFLMIESSQIDWGGHANEAGYVIEEMLEFDLVIEKVLEFAKKDGNTLVVVTSDHETGGFAINAGSQENNLKVGFTTGSHTAVMIPVFAYGPGAEQFTGVYDNTAIYNKMRRAFGFVE